MALTNSLEQWVGLVHLKPLDRTAYHAAGAYTRILTWANSVDPFRAKAELIASELGMYVVDVEGVESLEARTRSGGLTEAIEEMALRAQSNQNAIIYGTFHTYPYDDA